MSIANVLLFFTQDGERIELLVEGLKRGLAINETLPSDAGRVDCILENGTKTSCVLFIEGEFIAASLGIVFVYLSTSLSV